MKKIICWLCGHDFYLVAIGTLFISKGKKEAMIKCGRCELYINFTHNLKQA